MAPGYMAYGQVQISEEDRKKTAFIPRYCLFELSMMGMCLCNAPATFQRAMQLVLWRLTWKQVLVYLDDVIVQRKDFADSLANLRMALQRFREHSPKLKPRKCDLFHTVTQFLEKVVSKKEFP
jgi:hypothetical protein